MCCKCKLLVVTTHVNKRIFIWQVSDEVEQSCQICALLVTDGWKENQDPKLPGFLSNLQNKCIGRGQHEVYGSVKCYVVFTRLLLWTRFIAERLCYFLCPYIYCFILCRLFKYLCAFRSSNFIFLPEKRCSWQWLWANNTQDVRAALCTVFLCLSNLDYVFCKFIWSWCSWKWQINISK